MDLELVVVGGDGVERDIVVTARPGHLVADLAQALGDHLGLHVGRLHVAGRAGSRPLDPAVDLQQAGLRRGELLLLRPRPPVTAGWEVVVVSGPDAGRRLPIARRAELGRSPDADLRVHDPFVSRRHLRLDPGESGVRVTDLDSANGTLVAGRPVAPDHVVGDEPLELGSTLLRIRRGRPAVRPAGSADSAGDVEVSVASRPPVPVAAPVDALRTVEGLSVDEVLRDEARRQRARWPDLPTLAAAAENRDELLWSRASWPGELRVRVGWGAGQAILRPHDDVPGQAAPVPAVPIVVDLAAGVTQLEGDREVVHGIARALLLQAGVLVPPAVQGASEGGLQVTVLVATDRADGWSWVRWLPHCRRQLVVEPDVAGLHLGAGEAASVVRDLVRSASPASHLVVLDAGLAGAADHLAALAASGIRVVTVGAVPGPVAGTVAVDPHDGAVEVVADGRTTVGAGADGVLPDVAVEVARALAPLVPDGHRTEVEHGRPPLVSIVPAADPDGIAATWAANRPRRVPVGVTAAGPATISLDDDVFVAGEASEVRRAVAAVVVGAATTIGPDRIAFAVDEGLVAGASPIADLPHVVAVASGERLAADVDRELERRGAWLASVGARSWGQLRGGRTDVPAPLVVVLGAGSEQLVGRLRAEGPRLGVHLVRVAADGEATGKGVALACGRDGRATLQGGAGPVELHLADPRPPQVEPDTSLRVAELVAGRATFGSYTTLQRIPDPVDPVAALVTACREAARIAGRARATWCPSPPAGQDLRVRRTFVFTDIVGSTALVEVIGDVAWADLVGWHDRALREAFADHGGEEVDHAGDGFLVAFTDEDAAVACASDIQRRLEQHRVEAGFAPRVRIGGAVAEVVRTEGYKGHGLHVAARVGSLADGDQVIFSAETIEAIQPRPRTVSSRVVEVKGATEPIEVLEVDWR